MTHWVINAIKNQAIFAPRKFQEDIKVQKAKFDLPNITNMGDILYCLQKITAMYMEMFAHCNSNSYKMIFDSNRNLLF